MRACSALLRLCENPTMDLPTHQLTMTVLMTPDMANFSGNVHGGTILKLLDQVAYACASRYARSYVVTLSVDHRVTEGTVAARWLAAFRSRLSGLTEADVWLVPP